MLDKKWLTLLFSVLFFVGCSSENMAQRQSYHEFVYPSQEEILFAINKVRSQNIDCKNGLGYVGPSQPVRWNEELYNSANEHSEDMAYSGIFSHDGSGTEYDTTGYNQGKKSDFSERIVEHGYDNYRVIGENIAGGYFHLDQVIEEWKKSPEHCENLMRDEFDEMGVAITINPNSQYGIYWTQNFGRRNVSEKEQK